MQMKKSVLSCEGHINILNLVEEKDIIIIVDLLHFQDFSGLMINHNKHVRNKSPIAYITGVP